MKIANSFCRFLYPSHAQSIKPLVIINQYQCDDTVWLATLTEPCTINQTLNHLTISY